MTSQGVGPARLLRFFASRRRHKMAMYILCLGLSHRTAPVELRERLCYTPSSLNATLARFGCGADARPAGFEELTILSTCNRLEVYAAASVEEFGPLIDLVAETTGVARSEFEKC